MATNDRRRTHRGRRSLGRLIALAAVSATSLTACAFGPPPPDASGQPPNLPSPSPSSAAADGGDGTAATADVIAKHLQTPWGLDFLPDGSALVTERKSATIVRVAPPIGAGGLTVTPVATIAGVDAAGDGGLLGIAVSPKVRTDHTAFVYYSTAKDNRIGAIRLPATVSTTPPSGEPPSVGAGPSGGAVPPSAPEAQPSAKPATIVPRAIVTGIPHAATDNGGWLGFGPDGALYAGTGDAGRAAASQDRTSLAGKVLRMSTAGKPVGGASLVYASGLHNVQGFGWDQANHLYGVDARGTSDGVLAIKSGGNYGWGTSASGSENAAAPVETLPAAQAGCAGVALVQNILATACLTGQRLWLMQLAGTGSVFGAPQSGLARQFGRLRTVVTAPDGSLWITTSNTDDHGQPSNDDDRIIRVVVADEGAGKS
jgi:glucose/arabinose dehydrogenase